MFIFLILFFVFGLIIGSFLNVLIYRLENKKRKTLWGRSFCPHCEKRIEWYDNIPVVSFLFLGGKCRHCKKKISIQYPLVELTTGFLFALLFVIPNGAMAELGNPFAYINLIFWFFFASCLMVVFVYDLKHQIIPDQVIYTALITGFLYVSMQFALLGDFKYLADHLSSALIAGGFFYILAAISNGKWMGGGDIKLVSFMGLVLGWQGTVISLYVAFVLGAIMGVILLISKKKKFGSKIPFGPFLIIGNFIGLFFGEQLINFYVKMFLS